MNRKLCGVYFRVERDGKWQNICFSDMTKDEREKVLCEKPDEFLRGLCHRLADVLKEIGDEFDIVRE